MGEIDDAKCKGETLSHTEKKPLIYTLILRAMTQKEYDTMIGRA